MTSRPDVLVLGAGGTLGIAWLRGMVAGLDADLSRCEYFVGTSAGAYVAAHLASGGEAPMVEAPDAAARAQSASSDEVGPLRRVVGSGLRAAAVATAPVAPMALRLSRAPGAAARAALLRTARSDRPLRLGSLDLGDFDGRLRIATVDRATGRRVMFGAPGAPDAGVADAVLASCSVPWMFAPVRIGDREYVDGGVWSMSNLDAAPGGRHAEVLALLPTFGRAAGAGPTGLLRAAGQAAALAELQVLRARGLHARIIAPDAAALEAIGPDLFDASRVDAVRAAGLAQGRNASV